LRDEPAIHRALDRNVDAEVWVAARYQEVRAALADRRLSTQLRGPFEKAMQAIDDAAHALFDVDRDLDDDLARRPRRHMLKTGVAEHDRLRALVSSRFSPRRVEMTRVRVQQVADQLLDVLAPRDVIDIQMDYAHPLSLTVICDLLGLPVAEIGHFTIPPETWQEQYELRRYVLDHIQRMRPTVDLADPDVDEANLSRWLMVAQDDQGRRLNDWELLDMLDLLLVAGTAPMSLIGNGVFALLDQPDALVLLRDQPDLVPAAVEEILRFEGGDDHVRYRVALEDVVIGGVTIPKGDIVKLILASANRDSRAFDEPDRLRLTREPNRHIAFGRGIHVCLGAPLARLESQIAIESLLRRFPNLALVGSPEEVRWESHGIDGRQWQRAAVPVRLSAVRSS
jgi:6-deoxyerythronolide B hydroxylase